MLQIFYLEVIRIPMNVVFQQISRFSYVFTRFSYLPADDEKSLIIRFNHKDNAV